MRPLVFMDTETTGLDPGEHEMIEFAAVFEGDIWLVDLRNGYGFRSRPTTATLELKILPEHPETASPKALEITGYTPEKWAAEGAIPMSEALPRIIEFVERATLANTYPKLRTLHVDEPKKWKLFWPMPVGQNIPFDLRFLKDAFEKHDLMDKWPFHYHHLDTMTLAYEHLKPLGQHSVGLWAICKTLGISNEGAHTALVDAQRCREAFHKLVRATWWDRLRWKRHIKRWQSED